VTHDEQVVWQELSHALNLSPDEPVNEQTDEEKAVAYWDAVFAKIMYPEYSAVADAVAFAHK
jgi:hypothetical protein